MTGRVHIAAVGARTPLGSRAVAASAAMRASISGLQEHPCMVDRNGDRIVGGYDPTLELEQLGPERLAALFAGALGDIVASLPNSADLGPIPLHVALPELRPGFRESDGNRLGTLIRKMDSGSLIFGRLSMRATGHAGGLLALGTVAGQIYRGEVEAALVAGIDSYFHQDCLDWLEDSGQLMGATNRSAFAPGEGAGLCLLVSDDFLRRRGWRPLAEVFTASYAREEKLIKTDAIVLGEGMTQAVAKVTERLPEGARINAIISDQNGERYRSDEWGFTSIRQGAHFDDPTGYLAPAAWWGDMGAASGTLFAMLACLGAVEGRPDRTLLVAGSEGGLRATVLLGPGTKRTAVQ